MEGLIKKTQASRSATRLDLHVVGHVGEHEVVGGARVDAVVLGTDRFKFALEVFIGHRAGVLEFSQTLVGEEIEVTIGDEGFEVTATVIGDTVFGVREPAEEILRTVVEGIIDEVMTVTEIGFSFAIGEDFSFTVENLAHKNVTRLSKLSYYRPSISSTLGFGTHSRTIGVRYFLAVDVEEKGATFVRPEVKPRMFAASVKRREFVRAHSSRGFGCRRGRQR